MEPARLQINSKASTGLKMARNHFRPIVSVYFLVGLSSIIVSTSAFAQAVDEPRSVDPDLSTSQSTDIERIQKPSVAKPEVIPSSEPKPPLSDSEEGVPLLSPEELYAKGQAHEIGEAVTQNVALAWMYYHRAAEQDHVSSQYKLAEMSFHGIAVPINYARAAAWYERAAEAGHAKAQWMLGKMYLRGTGVPRDAHQGEYWLAKADESGLRITSTEERASAGGVLANEQQTAESLGEAKLNVVVEGSLSEFGEEVYRLWERTLNPELIYAFLARQRGVDAKFIAGDSVRLSEDKGVVVISLPVVTYVVRVSSGEESFGPWYVENPAMDYLAAKVGDDEILFSMNTEKTSISVRDGDGALVLSVDASGGAVEANWSKSLEMVTDIQMNWSDVEIGTAKSGQYVKIDAFSAEQDVVEADGGLWLLPSSLELTDVILRDDTVFPGSVRIGNCILSLELEGSMDQIRAVISQVGQVSNHGAEVLDGLPDEEAISKLLASLIRSFSIKAELSDFILSDLNEQDLGGIGSGKISAGFSDLDGDAASFDFSAGYEGLIYEANQSLEGLVPTSANIDLGLVSIPMKPFWDEVARVAQNRVGGLTEELDIVLDENVALDLVEGSDAHLHLRNLSIGSASYNFETTGRFYPNYEGIIPVYGNFSIVTVGLDGLFAHPLVTAFSTPYQEYIDQVIDMGRPIENGSLFFEFVTTKDGQVFLNDSDLLELFGEMFTQQAE